ncbi:MAG TPA: hypothetical protein PKW83_17165, partial [Verrucomicrobiota bacterium]|nr:hypothetical protein [Verrucomicrobiota bacterium]
RQSTINRFSQRRLTTAATGSGVAADMSPRLSVRPWTRIGSTAPTIYPSGRFESSKKMSKLQAADMSPR